MPETKNSKASTEQKSSVSKKLLLLVLLGAIGVRLFGIHHGLPYGYQVDEQYVVMAPMSFGTGDLNPGRFDSPGTTLLYLLFVEYGLFYVGGWILQVFETPMDFAELFLTNPTVFYLLARLTSVAFGTGTVYLVYRLGRDMYSARVGIVAAAFYAFSRLPIGIDHFAFYDTPLVFLCALAMVNYHNIMSRGRTRDYIFGGLVMGVAMATKYNGAALIIPLCVAHLIRSCDEGKRFHLAFFDKRVIMSWFMVPVGFIAGCPFSVLDYSTFIEDLMWQFDRVNSGSFGMDVDYAWPHYILTSLPYSIGVGLTVCSILGLFLALFKHRRSDFLIVSFTLCYFAYVGSWKVAVDKYLLPIMPFLALLAALFAVALVSRTVKSESKSNWALLAVALCLIAGPLARAVHNGYLLSQKDTRTQAKEWIEENVPAGTAIAVDGGNFDLAKFSPPLEDSPESVARKLAQIEKELPPGWSTSRAKVEQYFAIKMKYAKDDGYSLYHVVHTLDEEADKNVSVEEFKKLKIEYVVASSYAYALYDDPVYRKRNPDKAEYLINYYSSLDEQCRIVKTFIPLSDEGPGPIVKVYEVPYD